MEIWELYSYIQKHQPNICQISVLQNGNELYSAEWNSYQRTDCVHIASATKSVMALPITKSLIREKEKRYVRKEYYHSSGNERRLQSG